MIFFVLYLAHFLRNWTGMDVSSLELTLVQVMAWCRQATIHYLHCYLSQCRSRPKSSYGITGPQWVNSLAPVGTSIKFQLGNFHANFSEWWLRYLLWNCPQMNATRPYWWYVNIGSGNGLVPPGNKPLPESMLTQIYDAKWHHQATMSYGKQPKVFACHENQWSQMKFTNSIWSCDWAYSLSWWVWGFLPQRWWLPRPPVTLDLLASSLTAAWMSGPSTGQGWCSGNTSQWNRISWIKDLGFSIYGYMYDILLW